MMIEAHDSELTLIVNGEAFPLLSQLPSSTPDSPPSPLKKQVFTATFDLDALSREHLNNLLLDLERQWHEYLGSVLAACGDAFVLWLTPIVEADEQVAADVRTAVYEWYNDGLPVEQSARMLRIWRNLRKEVVNES